MSTPTIAVVQSHRPEHALTRERGNVARSQLVHEDAEIRGRFKVRLTIPHASDLQDFIRMRRMIAKLEMQAVISRHMQERVELFARADEWRILMDAVDQRVQMEDEFPNVVVTVGKNYALDGVLQTAVTIVGPYLGLIGAASYTTGPVAGDTMASHGGWTEAGTTNAPTYTSPRKTTAWSAASAGSKAFSAAQNFAMTGTGTAKGCFIVLSTGAVSTIDNTSGTLWSAGLFTGGDQPVVSGNTLAVSYTASM